MGWFLTNNKTKTKKKAKRSAKIDPAWDPQRTLLGVKFASAAGAVIVVAIGWHFGTQRLEAYVQARHPQPITAEDIRFSENPKEMSTADINLLRAELAGLIGENPLNRRGLQQAADLLRSRKDIVRELRQVRRLPDGTVQIDLDFRTPAAIVQMRNERTGRPSDDGYHVIDDMGYQMYGPRYLNELPNRDLPQIVGVNSKYRPKDNLGEYRWQGREVDAALRLIAELRNTPLIDCIEAVAVNARDERGRTRLVINTLVHRPGAQPIPCQIVWGLPPGEERSIEPDVDRKLAALHALLSDGNYQMGLWREVWINTGQVRPKQAITASR